MSAILRNKIIVIDVESTCWESAATTPPGQQSEIIEIGVCAFDVKTLEISDKRSILIRPARSKVSAFCTELTTLTQEQVDQGISFEEACAILQNEYEAKKYLWGSWGDYDRKMFENQCPSYGVEYPFSDRHVNIKKLFGKLYNRSKAVGMAQGLQIAGLELEGTHHRGGDDAYNIARILQKMIREKSKDILLSYY